MSSSSATPRNGGENTPQSSSHTNRSGRTAATRRAHGKVLAPVVDSSEDEPSPHSSIFEAPLASDSENEGGGNGGGGAGAGGGGGVGSSSSAARKGFNSGGIKIIQSSDVSGVGGERSQMGQSPGSYGSYSTSNTAPQPPHIHTSQQQQQPLNLSSSPPAVGAALLNSVPSDGGRSFDNRRTAAGRPSHNHNNLETITEQKSASDTAPPREDEIVAAEAAGSRSRSRSSSLGSDFSDGEDDEDDADEEVGDDAQLLPRGRRKKPSSEAYSNSNSRRSNYFDYYDAGEVYDYVSPSQPLYQSIAAMNNTGKCFNIYLISPSNRGARRRV
ncbi:hypothetical protein DFH27DRAFT_213363 [Peziza echinospora]|nr:hypothetical protein DFH27DRAFT_213363 [Peziza echinospora]